MFCLYPGFLILQTSLLVSANIAIHASSKAADQEGISVPPKHSHQEWLALPYLELCFSIVHL